MVHDAPGGTTTSPLTGPDSVPVHWVGGGGPAMAPAGPMSPAAVSTATDSVAHVFMLFDSSVVDTGFGPFRAARQTLRATHMRRGCYVRRDHASHNCRPP